jgi:hypothetical protein
MLLIALFRSDGHLVSRFPSAKQQFTMKTPSFTAFLLALAFLIICVDGTDRSRRLGMGMRKKKYYKRPSHPAPSPSPPHPGPSPSPPPPTLTACEQSCARIAKKPFIQCNFLEAASNFECQNLNLIISGQNGFKSQVECISYSVNYVNFSCPQGETTTSNPTGRCKAARCT